MKSVKKVFKKKLSPYNLRSRKSAVPVVKASTPKVNREVQASLSEEENCTLLCELPYYRSSVHESTHALVINDENQPSKSSNGPRLSTAFSSPSQADSTNREVINISIDQRREPSIVHPSSSKQSTPCGPREGSESSSLEDFTPIDSRLLQSGPQIALEIEEISEAEHEEPDPEQNSSFAHHADPLINSQLISHSPLRDRDRINYKKPKQNKTKKRSDSISSADSSYTETDGEREDSEDSEDEENKNNSEKETEADRENDDSRMDQPEITEFRKQIMDFQRQMDKQLKDTQAAMENVTVSEPTLAKPTLFHGYENENVDRWLQRFTLYLANTKIRTDSSQAAIQLALHLSGPAESFYYNLSSPVQSSFDDLRNAIKERFSPAHRSLRLRQALSIRRQGPTESIEKFLADLNEKFSCLDLRDEDKLSYLIQGLRPDIQAEVLKKEPKSYTEAEDTARLIYSIQQSLFQRREDDISRIVMKEKLSSPTARTAAQPASTDDKAILTALEQLLQKKTAAKEEETVLTKLEALCNRDSQAPDEQHERLLLSKYSDLLEKTARRMADSPSREPNTASLAAYAEPNKRETPDYMREIRRMEDKLEGLYRQMDARFKGLARRNSPNQVEQPRQRTREGQPICYTCGKVGHIQQNCNQRSSREARNYDRFQPNQQRRQTNDYYPSRSGYNQTHRRNELPSFNPRDPRMAVLDEDYADGFVAPLGQNTNNQTRAEERGKFPIINWSDVGSQIGKELTKQLTNTSHLVPGVIQQSQVQKTQLPTVVIEVPKQSDQQTMEQNNDGQTASEVTTAVRSERELPGNLETKPKPEIRQHLVTSPPDLRQPSVIQVNDPPQSQENHHPSGTVPFPNAVRRTKSRITADTDVIVDLYTEGNIKRTSDPDLSQPQPSPSAGTQSTAVNKDSLPNCMPDPIQTTGENPPITAEQCNISNNQAKPRDLTLTAKLNGQDIKLLVDTGAGMSVIDEQFTRDVYKGELPKLQKSALASVKTVSGEELPVLGKIKVILGIAGGKYPCELQVVKNLTYEAVLGRDFLRANGAVINLRQGTLHFDDSQSRGVNAARIATFSEENKQTPELLEEIRRMENGFTEKLENLNQRVDRMNRLARRHSTVCYKCGRIGHIQYNCYNYYQPESQSQKQEESQEFHAHYNQEENQRLATYPSARLSANAQYAQRVPNRHVNKAKSSGTVEQTYHQPVRTCNPTFEGEENSPGRALAAQPKQQKINSQEKAVSTTQLQQEVKPTRANKRQPQISHEQVPLPATNRRQSKPSNDIHSCKNRFKLKCNDLTTEGEIAGQMVQLLVDTGACVSAIDKQLFAKIYGHFPPNMSKGFLSSVQTVSGEKVPVLGKITIPLQLQGRKYTCEFHVMHNLAYDAILGRDFLQNNGALIDLVDSTLSFKGTASVGDHTRPKTVPVMGTFLSHHIKLKETNAVASHVNVVPHPEILKPKCVQRSEASKLMSCHQSLVLLILIVLYLLTASCTPPTENSENPVIQKPPKFFAREEHVLQDGHVVCTPVSLENCKKSDLRVDHNERKVPRVKALKSVVSLIETGDIQETMKSMSSSKKSSFKQAEEIHIHPNVKNQESQFISGILRERERF